MNSKRSLKDTIVPIIVVGAVFLGLFAYLLFIIHPTDIPNDEIMLGFLAISYQVIFLTTSLLSMLSDRSETIYWERFTEYVMVYPKIINFIGLSVAGYVSLIVQTICFFNIDWKYGFFISFCIGIAIIILLWWKMSSIYFWRNHYLKKLKETEKARIKGLEKLEQLKENNSPLTLASLLKIKKLFSIKERLDIIRLSLGKEQSKKTSFTSKIIDEVGEQIIANLYTLREFTYASIDNHNSRTTEENLDYLVELICYDMHIDETMRDRCWDYIRNIFDYMNTHNKSYWISLCLESNSDIFNEQLNAIYSTLSVAIRQAIMNQPKIKIKKRNLAASYVALNDIQPCPESTRDVLYKFLNIMQQQQSDCMKHNLILLYEIAEYIIQDVDRLNIWKALIEKNDAGKEWQSAFIYYFYCKYYPYPWHIEKGEEGTVRNYVEHHADIVEEVTGLLKKYGKFVSDYASFALNSDLSKELEVLIWSLLKYPDLIKTCPRVNVIFDSTYESNSFDLIFNVVGEDDHLLTLLIRAYSTVVFMLTYEDVEWDSNRDEEIVEKIIDIYNRKTEHDEILNSVYEAFMCEYVPAASAARKKYVNRLVETKDYKKLENVLSYDKYVNDFIKDQIPDESGSYYRVYLSTQKGPCTIVVPLEDVYTPNQDSGSENSTDESSVSNEPSTIESDEIDRESRNEEQKENVLDGIKTKLIKREYRPTGKNKKEMIDFWRGIRGNIPESKRSVLKELDDYLAALTGDI